ncbi:MAG: hypothetical protein L0H55_14890, partial [Candidatus Nitrosocosmicus sp.]|nr:hypothetical protein [Candidatus Nitrosocosmicus sp.]
SFILLFLLLLAIQAANIHSPSILGSLIAAQGSMVQSEPRSHPEHVNFEPSQHTSYKILQDFHIVRAGG